MLLFGSYLCCLKKRLYIRDVYIGEMSVLERCLYWKDVY